MHESLLYLANVSKFSWKQTIFSQTARMHSAIRCQLKGEFFFPLKCHEWGFGGGAGVRLHKYSAEKAKIIRNMNEINPKAGRIEQESFEMKKKCRKELLQKQIGLCHMGETFLLGFWLKTKLISVLVSSA